MRVQLSDGSELWDVLRGIWHYLPSPQVKRETHNSLPAAADQAPKKRAAAGSQHSWTTSKHYLVVQSGSDRRNDNVLGDKRAETSPTGSGSHASPQNEHRGLVVRSSREQALLPRWKCWHRPATRNQQIVLLQDGAERRSALQTGGFTLMRCFVWFYSVFAGPTRGKKQECL